MLAGYDCPFQTVDPALELQYPWSHEQIDQILSKSDTIIIRDHHGGFQNSVSLVTYINDKAVREKRIVHLHTGVLHYLLHSRMDVKTFLLQYPGLYFYDNWCLGFYKTSYLLLSMKKPIAPNFKNFVISFNGTMHVSRQLLVSALFKRQWFNTNYSTKNFVYTANNLYENLNDLVGNKINFYKNFFSFDDIFAQAIYTHQYNRYHHDFNFLNLQSRISESFVHLVSDTLATDHSALSEKFLYSVINKGLYVCYSGDRATRWSEQIFGFKPYKNIFDYGFDEIADPVDRLLEILSMLDKFSNLSSLDWHDLYLLEQDNIEYNYENFFSKKFVEHYKSAAENLIQQGN